jgi:hypothetical protein
MNVRITSAIATLTLISVACGGRTVVVDAPATAVTPAKMAELWKDPGTERSDLFWGIGGKQYAPPADAVYEFEAKDDSGFSVSYDVVSPDGTEWSAKIGPEAQTEVVMSRLLWALGYHQPPVYYLPSWKLDSGSGEPRIESEARFRPKLKGLERLDEYWSWADNPFSGTRPFKGLLVTLLMLNSSDLKDDNNSIYEVAEPLSDGVPRWFVVRDVGASLGDTGKLYPRRNWIEGFEKHGFIKSVGDGRIEFHYKGRHDELLSMIEAADVQWAAQQMQRLTDQQWRDAFRAANYADPIAERYIRRIREKIDDGLALRADTDARLSASTRR